MTRILGVDVSHHEPALDWQKAKAGGVQWMFTKATEGLHHVDIMLHQHVGSAKGAGVLTGAYHFFHPSASGLDQANLYLKSVSDIHLELPHCLDWEVADSQTSLAQQKQAKAWLDTVEKKSGRVPVIYGGSAFLRNLKLGPEFARYPLWIANYGVNEPHVPQPWKQFTMWQYTDAESVPGLAPGHHVDANVFLGSVEDLHKFAG